jgi:hypothetical protein
MGRGNTLQYAALFHQIDDPISVFGEVLGCLAITSVFVCIWTLNIGMEACASALKLFYS